MASASVWRLTAQRNSITKRNSAALCGSAFVSWIKMFHYKHCGWERGDKRNWSEVLYYIPLLDSLLYPLFSPEQRTPAGSHTALHWGEGKRELAVMERERSSNKSKTKEDIKWIWTACRCSPLQTKVHFFLGFRQFEDWADGNYYFLWCKFRFSSVRHHLDEHLVWDRVMLKREIW